VCAFDVKEECGKKRSILYMLSEGLHFPRL
jgi:hypothetical protein